MFGQGCPGPIAIRGGGRRWGPRPCRWRLLAAGWLFALAATANALATDSVRLRIAWGGGPERLWQGRIALTDGTISEPKALGIEADEVGSMWLAGGSPDSKRTGKAPGQRELTSTSAEGYLAIRQRSPRTYDAVDVSIVAPRDVKLLIDLYGVDEPPRSKPIEVRLADVLHTAFSADLDGQGSRLVVRRVPGDELRVRLARPSLVFASGETLKFELEPNLLPVEPGTKLRVKIQLCSARTSQEVRPSEEIAFTAGQTAPLAVEVPLHVPEGVYDVVATVAAPAKIPWPQAVRSPLTLRPPLAERTIQVVVLGDRAKGLDTPEARLSVVQEIDPANPKWWAKFASLPQLPRWPKIPKGPLGNGMLRTWTHALGPVAQLAPNSQSPDVSWEAYPLPRPLRPGEPHVLEIEYPSDVIQTLGVSIVEANAAGAVIPVGLDSGVDQAEEVVPWRSSPQWLRHRLVFWPRTETPIVLIANLREGQAAAYGKIRVLAGWQRLPRAVPSGKGRPSRLWAAYMDRPLFPENFSASEAVGASRDLSVDDWVTFYEGGSRLVEYLQHVGYGGLMLTVFADGSTIYPSSVVEPTPRYDTGVFLPSGHDPVRKDVLEMLLRLFDREALALIPAVEFASPLPELEAVLRRGGSDTVGMLWVGPDGATWQETYPSQRGRSPYYNVLHPRVQEAMLAVVRELATTYAEHPSFAGLAIQLSAHGYAHLLGPTWGLDDATIERFERETQVRVPGEGPRRYVERARFLNGEARKTWLDWRAAQLSRFYARVRAELAAVRKDLPLYLAATDLFANPDLRRDLEPALPQRTTMAEALLRVGIDSRHFGSESSVVLVRPERIAAGATLARRAIDLEIQQMPDADRYFQGLSRTASLFFHPPREVRIPSFDDKCPFKPCYTWLASQPVPSSAQNRRRFVHALATLDAQVMFDGGWLLSMGQEEAIRDLVAVYRQLPPVRLEGIADQNSSASAQPVTVRCGVWNERTYAYAVNDAPFPVSAQVRVEGPAGFRMEGLAGAKPPGPLRRDADGAYWAIELGPYDLVAASFSAPNVRLSKPVVAWPNEVRAALETRLSELGSRAAALRSPPLLEVLENPGFDRSPGPQGQIPGWIPIAPSGFSIRLDRMVRHGGPQSVHLASTGAVGGLVSHAFAPPVTGRLAVSVWLRTADEGQQPPLRVAIEGRASGPTYYRFNQFGREAHGQEAVRPIPAEWTQFVIEANDLPLEGLGAVRVRLELLGAGEVWIDDVQLCELAFDRREHKELLRLLTPGDVQLQNGRIGDCIRLLEGYWPRFLVDYVPFSEPGPIQPVEVSGPRTRSAHDAERSSGLFDRFKTFVPHRLRF